MDYIRWDRDVLSGGERFTGALWDFPRDYLLVTVDTPAPASFVFRRPGRRGPAEPPEPEGPTETPAQRRKRAARRGRWSALSRRTQRRYVRVLLNTSDYGPENRRQAARLYRAGYGTNIYHRRQPARSLERAERPRAGATIANVVDYPVHFIEDLAERFVDEAVPAFGYDQAADRVRAGVGLPPGRATAYARLYIKPN